MKNLAEEERAHDIAEHNHSQGYRQLTILPAAHQENVFCSPEHPEIPDQDTEAHKSYGRNLQTFRVSAQPDQEGAHKHDQIRGMCPRVPDISRDTAVGPDPDEFDKAKDKKEGDFCKLESFDALRAYG